MSIESKHISEQAQLFMRKTGNSKQIWFNQNEKLQFSEAQQNTVEFALQNITKLDILQKRNAYLIEEQQQQNRKTIIIQNLETVNEKFVRNLFEVFGEIKKMSFISGATLQQHFSTCLIQYESKESADNAKLNLQSFILDNTPITIQSGESMINIHPLSVPQMHTLYASQQSNSATNNVPSSPLISNKNISNIENTLESTQIQGNNNLNDLKSQNYINTKNQTRIYLAQVHWDLNESDIKKLFMPYGKIKRVKLLQNAGYIEMYNNYMVSLEQIQAALERSQNPNDENTKKLQQQLEQMEQQNLVKPHHRGCGYIDFEKVEEAQMALQSMNNKIISGKSLKVSYQPISISSSSTIHQ